MKRELWKYKVANKRKVCKKFDMLPERFHYTGIYDWSPLKNFTTRFRRQIRQKDIFYIKHFAGNFRSKWLSGWGKHVISEGPIPRPEAP